MIPVWLKRVILGSFLALAAAVVVGPRLGRHREKIGPGAAAPGFQLRTLQGAETTLRGLRGKVVFINFWATWCAPCVEEMPAIQALAQKLRGRPFEVLGINEDAGDPSKVGGFVRDHHLTFPVLLDSDARVAEAYGTTGVPETFVVDRDGVVVGKYVGPRDWADSGFVHEIELFLGKATP